MPRTIPPPLSLALNYLRSAQGWSQKELAEAAGIPANLISDYERGRKTLSRERLETMAAFMGLPSGAVDTALGFLQTIREGSREPGPPSVQNWRIEAVAAQAARLMSDFTRQMLGMLTAETRALEARQQAVSLWVRLKRYGAAQRRTIVEEIAEFRNWALCELLCEESIKAAADSADRALELASLALRVADLLPGEEAWRSRVQGYAWAHAGNARRVKGDLPGADEAFGRSQKLWRAGATGDSGLLDEARVLGLESSLRRAQRLLSEAMELLDRALVVDQGYETKYLLLNKAKLLEELGDFEGAITTLRRAIPFVEAAEESRFPLAFWQHLAANLCFLGQFGEAQTLVPKLRNLASNYGDDLDLLRLRWLEGRVVAGLGKGSEAIRILSGAREGFTSRGMAYDGALISLELALVYLEEGRTAEVKILARQITPVFQAQGIHREALAAFKLFRDAAEREGVTVQLARKLLAYFQRAQHDPGLRFEDVEAGL
jgi:transcriptional regulator with XRE-family HTH domain